jgi:hypothetical protein
MSGEWLMPPPGRISGFPKVNTSQKDEKEIEFGGFVKTELLLFHLENMNSVADDRYGLEKPVGMKIIQVHRF